MSTRTYRMTEELRQRWIAEGRGQGEGAGYKGWLTTNDVNSIGNKTREPERLHGHLCHWLSDHETDVARVLQLNPFVSAMLDQFPIPIEDSRAIAKELGIKHPADPDTRVDINITTDIVCEFRRGDNFSIGPFNIKMDSDLQIYNNPEHAEIERRWWLSRHAKLRFLNASPKYISPVLKANAREIAANAWIHTDNHPTANHLSEVAHHLHIQIVKINNASNIAELCESLDGHLGVKAGTSINTLYFELAHRHLTANVRAKPVLMHTTAEMLDLNPHLVNLVRRKA